eukprot:6223481-Amphidinium_carterae.1
MLHAVALAELEDLDNGMDDLGVRSFKMELVDAGLPSRELRTPPRLGQTPKPPKYKKVCKSSLFDMWRFVPGGGGLRNSRVAMRVACTRSGSLLSLQCD